MKVTKIIFSLLSISFLHNLFAVEAMRFEDTAFMHEPAESLSRESEAAREPAFMAKQREMQSMQKGLRSADFSKKDASSKKAESAITKTDSGVGVDLGSMPDVVHETSIQSDFIPQMHSYSDAVSEIKPSIESQTAQISDSSSSSESVQRLAGPESSSIETSEQAGKEQSIESFKGAQSEKAQSGTFSTSMVNEMGLLEDGKGNIVDGSGQVEVLDKDVKEYLEKKLGRKLNNPVIDRKYKTSGPAFTTDDISESSDMQVPRMGRRNTI